MPDRAVINASPLIFLSPIDGLSWLVSMFTAGVSIPAAVANEVAAGHDGDKTFVAQPPIIAA
jgi:hypothetical protein